MVFGTVVVGPLVEATKLMPGLLDSVVVIGLLSTFVCLGLGVQVLGGALLGACCAAFLLSLPLRRLTVDQGESNWVLAPGAGKGRKVEGVSSC